MFELEISELGHDLAGVDIAGVGRVRTMAC